MASATPRRRPGLGAATLQLLLQLGHFTPVIEFSLRQNCTVSSGRSVGAEPHRETSPDRLYGNLNDIQKVIHGIGR